MRADLVAERRAAYLHRTKQNPSRDGDVLRPGQVL